MAKRNAFYNMISMFGSRPSQKVKPTETIGQMGTAVYGGYIVSNEKDKRLTNRERYRTFSDILANTSIVAAGVRYFLNLTAKVNWKIEPADNSLEARKVADFVEQALFQDMSTPWFKVVRRAAMHRFYGFSIQEWTARRRKDGLLTFADVDARAQLTITRWNVDITGKVYGVIQQSEQDSMEIYLPRNKLLYTVDDTLNDSPEGLGLFRHIVEASKRLQRYEQLEGFGYETDLRGIPVGRAPISDLDRERAQGTLKSEDVANKLNVVTSFIKKHIKNPKLGIVLDSATYRDRGENQTPSSVYKYNMELMRGDSPNLTEVAGAIDRVNREIARVFGVEHLLLGDGDRGSEALARSKADNFALIVESTLNEIRQSIDKDLIKTLLKINGIDKKLKPKISTDSVSFRSIEQITASLRDMAQAGAPLSPDDEAINEVRSLLGLSNIPIDEMDMDAFIGRDIPAAEAQEPKNERVQTQEQDLNDADINSGD